MPARKRKLVDGMLVDCGVSIRRACEALRFDTSSYHYKSRSAGQAGLELRIKEICETRVRNGYRRVHVLLRREGWRVNIKRARRVYNELGNPKSTGTAGKTNLPVRASRRHSDTWFGRMSYGNPPILNGVRS